MKFQTIVSDPAWNFNDSLPTYSSGSSFGHRGAAGHYDCIKMDDLKKIKIPNIADDAVLFLWKVAAMPEEAYDVIRAWGFTPKSELVWLKRTKTGKRHFGMGRYVRGEHETCVIAAKGRGHKLVKTKNIRSTFEAPAGKHSEKPDIFYNIVEEMVEGPYLELFSRKIRPGWICLGNEVCNGEDINKSLLKLNDL